MGGSKKEEEEGCLNDKLRYVDMILVGVESFHDAPFEFTRGFIHLSKIHHLAFVIFAIAVIKEDDLGPIKQFRILLDLNHDPNLVGIQ